MRTGISRGRELISDYLETDRYLPNIVEAAKTGPKYN